MTDFNFKTEGRTEPRNNAASSTADITAVSSNDDSTSRAKELLVLHHSNPNRINFDITKELALECVDDILGHWLPDGEQRGKQYVALNPTRDDSRLGSFSINMQSGVWADFSTDDRGGDLTSLVAYLEGGIKQPNAAAKILEFIAGLSTDDGVAVVKHNSNAKVPAKEKLTVIMPVPDSAREQPKHFQYLGSPSATWTYRNEAGQTLFFVNRFETEGGKTYRPSTYCRDASGRQRWAHQAPPEPRPAYGLDRLAAQPDAPVLFTEGEKSADAAQRLFPGFVAVTTMNGAKSPEKSDFRPFAGRKVYIAQDNDEAGSAYKDKLIQLLRAAGAEIVAVLRLELLVKNGVPLTDRYDLADAEIEGWTAESLALLGEALWEPISNDGPVPPAPKSTSAQKADQAAPSKKKTQLDFANEFAKEHYNGNIASLNNQILAFSEGYWAALNPDVDIKRPLLAAIGDEVTAAKVNGVFELIKIQYASNPEKFERSSPLICLNNLTLNPINGERLPHTVEHFLTNKVGIDYDRDAQCPLWFQTLNEIFAHDADKAEKIQLVQEYIGYCLIPDTRMHKFLWMVGSGGNGKSLILAVITALIGKVNISYAAIERLQEKFVRAELQGKLVNISPEMSAQATISDGYLKQITAGDIIEAERKNERPFSFKPYARLIGATNLLPRLLDHSDGFFRRAMILRFNRQFTQAEIDTQREAKLMAELPGILNWAVAGLQNLMERGSFVIPSSAKAEVEQYRVNSDPVRQFAEGFLKPTADKALWEPAGSLYERYKEWSGVNGYKALASNQFAERISGVGIEKERRSEGRYWKVRYVDPAFRSMPPSISPSASKYVL